MSQENVESVRHLYESGLIDRDPDELLKGAIPDVEYINPPYAVEPGVRRGVAAVAQAMRRFGGQDLGKALEAAGLSESGLGRSD